MADSQNTLLLPKFQQPMSRRAVLSTSIAATALAAVPVPAAELKQPDAALIELGQELELVSAEISEYDRRITASYRAAKLNEPPLPEVLRFRPEDDALEIPKPRDKKYPGYYTSFDIGDLKAFRPSRTQEVPIKDFKRSTFPEDHTMTLAFLDKEVLVKVLPWPEAQARIDEIIAAATLWSEACHRLYNDDDPELQAQEDALLERQTELHEAILSQRATTLAGLRVKANAIKGLHAAEEELGLGETTDVLLATSLIADLMAINT